MKIPEKARLSYGAVFNDDCLILPTTKHFFDLVLSGEKKIEYRKDAPFYDRLFKNHKEIKYLYLHYRSKRTMRCDVSKIVKKPRPACLHGSKFITTEKCYAIHVFDPTIVME